MDIVLDSNIYRGDILLKSKDIEVLLDYLNKTKSKIYLPQIVLEEIKELYRRQLKDNLATFNISKKKLEDLLIEKSHISSNYTVNESALAEDYILYIRERFKIEDNQILPSNNNYLEEVTKRAIQRQKPCGEKGQGFRDTILWLVIKDHCFKLTEKKIIFISNNDSDFSNSSKEDLHETLQEECRLKGIKVYYFKSIRDFIEKHSINLKFINKDWLWSKIDKLKLNEIIFNYLNSGKSNYVREIINAKTQHICASLCQVTFLDTFSLDEFHIYEKTDGTYIISILIASEIGVEYEYYSDQSITLNISIDLKIGRQTNKTYKIFDAEIYCLLSLKDNEIVGYEIDDIFV